MHFEMRHDDPWICYAFEDAIQYVVMIIECKILKTHWDLLSVILRYQYVLVLEIERIELYPCRAHWGLDLVEEE